MHSLATLDGADTDKKRAGVLGTVELALVASTQSFDVVYPAAQVLELYPNMKKALLRFTTNKAKKQQQAKTGEWKEQLTNVKLELLHNRSGALLPCCPAALLPCCRSELLHNRSVPSAEAVTYRHQPLPTVTCRYLPLLTVTSVTYRYLPLPTVTYRYRWRGGTSPSSGSSSPSSRPA